MHIKIYLQPSRKRQNHSRIFIYNHQGKEIPLTYLLHLHSACISINIISGLACVITKVLITFHRHIYCCFQFCFLLYYSSTRVFPRQGWRRETICLTRQFYSLSNPRMGCYRSDHRYCSCVCEIKGYDYC